MDGDVKNLVALIKEISPPNHSESLVPLIAIILEPYTNQRILPSRYLTTMQLGQFVTFFVHASLPLFIECDFPKIFSYVILFHGAMFFLLFANFYRQTYTKKSKTGIAKKTDVNGNGVVKTD